MSTSDTIFNRIAWLCSRREYCSRGVLDLLRRKGVAGEEAVAVLERLREEGYVDDGRYARAFARDKALLSGWGPKKIVYVLTSKGIAADVAKTAISEVSEQESASRMKAVIKVKWKSVKSADVRDRRAKVLRFALSRGYDCAAVIEVLDSLEE